MLFAVTRSRRFLKHRNIRLRPRWVSACELGPKVRRSTVLILMPSIADHFIRVTFSFRFRDSFAASFVFEICLEVLML